MCKIIAIANQMSDGELKETQMANYFSNVYPIDCVVLTIATKSF